MSELDHGTTADQDIINVWLSDDGTDPVSPEQNPIPDQGYDQPGGDLEQMGNDPGQVGLDPQQEGVDPVQPDMGGAPDDAQPGEGPDGGESEVTDYPDVVVDGQLIGDPQGASEHWFEQAANGFCLPSSLAQIISEYTGVHYGDEQAFVDWANEERLFQVSPDGVPGIAFSDGVQLLEKAGVPATLQFGDLDSLAEDLAEGRGVVLFVDSGEIWEGGEATEDNAPDHAVVVSGIDTARGVVFLSDPGSPDGNMEEVPIDVFNNAWADSQNSMIVCDQPDPDVLSVATANPDVTLVDRALVDDVPVEGTPVDGALEYAFQCAAGWVLLPVCLPADLIGG